MNPANFFISFSVTFLSMFALMPLAKRYGLIDEPGGRKLHARPTPLIGGVGIYLGILVITLFSPDILNHYSGLLAISLPILLIGVGDDLLELPVSARLGTHTVSAVMMCLFAGVQLVNLGDILGLGEVHLGYLAIPFTVFCTVGVINTVNMSDGVDGLSGGMVLIALGFLFSAAVTAGNITMSPFILILIFALIAFLVFNFQSPWKRAAMVYLGDAGSTFLGFVLAWLLIEATQGINPVIPAALAPWFLALPLMDTVALLIRRPLKGLSPFHPGRDHLHHYLMDRGLSQSATVILLLCLNTAIGVTGWLMWRNGASDATLFYSFFGLFIAYLINPFTVSVVKAAPNN